MKKIRNRLTYANVVSSLALFLVLGGATAFAAVNGLAKGSVGSAQLKAGAVTESKVKDDSITASKIDNGAVTAAAIKNGGVKGADIENQSISGAKIDLKTLGKVPSAEQAVSAQTAANAVNAQSAASAIKAEHATEAAQVAGQTPAKIFARVPKSAAPETTIASFGGFTITAACKNSGTPTSILLHSPPAAETVFTGLVTSEGETPIEEYEAGSDIAIRLNTTKENGEATFSGTTTAGLVVAGSLGFDSPPTISPSTSCVFYGQVMVG